MSSVRAAAMRVPCRGRLQQGGWVCSWSKPAEEPAGVECRNGGISPLINNALNEFSDPPELSSAYQHGSELLMSRSRFRAFCSSGRILKASEVVRYTAQRK